MAGPDGPMFDLPIDTVYVWLGVAAVSAAALAVVLALPTTAPPDAAAAADAVDRVVVEPPGSQATRQIDAEAIRLGPRQISLRNEAGSASASVAYGPITPTLTDDRLELVLHGRPPSVVFESPVAFAEAVETAQTRTDWRPAPERIEIRRVDWGGIDVTLVG